MLSPPARRSALSVSLPLIAATLGAAPQPVSAEPATAPSQPNVARAEALFLEALRSLKEGKLDPGKLDEACSKLAESQRLDPSPGTLLNLGDCRERQGKFASAVDAFHAASRVASWRSEHDRAAEGEKRASLLESKLSYLTVRVEGSPRGLVVKIDEAIAEQTNLGLTEPVDIGEHVVTAQAPGHKPFRTVARVEQPRQTVVVIVPALMPLSGAGGEARATPTERPVAGYVAGGLGLAALGVGAAFGALAISNYSKVRDGCSFQDGCPDRDRTIDTLDRANGQAWVANVSVGLGLVGVATGAYLLFIAPPKKTSASAGPALGATLAPGVAALGLSGSF